MKLWAVLELGAGKELSKADNVKFLDKCIEAKFKSSIGLELSKEMQENFGKVFEKSRAMLGLFLYAGRLTTLPSTQNTSALNALKQFAQHVLLGGAYQEWRYLTKHTPNLAKITEKQPTILTEWATNKTNSLHFKQKTE